MSEVIRFPMPTRAAAGDAETPEPSVGQTASQAPRQRTTSDEERPLELRWLVGVLRRRKSTVMACLLLIPIAVTMVVFNLTPRYQASTRLLIEGQRENILNIESVQKGMTFDMSTVETEAEVLRSREMATRAVLRLGLLDDPRFNPMLKPVRAPHWFDGIRETYVNPAIAWVRGHVDWPWLTKLVDSKLKKPKRNLTQAQILDGAVDGFMGELFVIPAPLARVITVQYTSVDPDLSARAANMIAELYIEIQRDTKIEANERASAVLTDRVAELRSLVLDSQRKLDDYRNGTGIIELEGVTLLRQQISHIHEKLLQAEAQQAEVVARYEEARKHEGSLKGDATSNVLDSQLISDLRIREATLQQKIVELRTRYRDGHPKSLQAAHELKDLRSTIKTEMKKVLTSLEIEASIVTSRVEKLRVLLLKAEDKFSSEREAEAALRALETEVNVNKQLYQVLLERLKETDIQDQTLQVADARIISRAIVPRNPIFPRKRIMVFASVVVSVIIGVLLAIALEYFIAGYRTIRDLENDTGFPVLTMIPTEPEIRRYSKPMYRYITSRPHSRLAEAMRKLRTALSLATPGAKTVMVCSSMRGEGKSTTSLGLAMLAARAGQRVLIMDCDLRLPKLHTELGQSNLTGMSDLLAGRSEIDEVVEFDIETGLYFITSGPHFTNSEDLLGSERMRELLRQVREEYDYVVIDTPPILSVADALLIVPYVDQMVMAVRWEVTNRESVTRAIRVALESGARIPGTVLTQVDLNIQKMVYGHDYNYYYYYGSPESA